VATTTELAAEVMRRGTGAARLEHAALFERILARMHRYFRKTVWRADVADDLVQETIVLLERSLRDGKYDPDRSFNTWMWLKAHTVFAQWCRRQERERGRRVPLEPEHENRPGPDPAATTEERLDKDRVLRAVQEEIGDEAYEIFCLYYAGGLTQAEVSEATGRDRKTVREKIRAAHRVIDRLLR